MIHSDYSNLAGAAFDRRAGLFSDSSNTCFRLINSDGDCMPGVTADLYGEYVLIQLFDPDMDGELSPVVSAVLKRLSANGVTARGVLLKNRAKIKAAGNISEVRNSSLVEGSFPPEFYTVAQNGIKYEVDLISGQNTGLFLDMREIRENLRKYYAPDLELLNLFSYTGAFSIHALKNGIKSAVNVDLSKTVLGKARRNYEINGLPTDMRDFIRGDTFEWARRFSKKGKRFSYVVFDPPTFSRNRERSFSVKNDYLRAMLLIEKISAGGLVFTSINSHSVSREQYMAYHPTYWQLIEFWNESSDFPYMDRPYLKAGLWRAG